ncbi:hypothetical protein [Streptomyces sp. NPDC002402]
MVTKEQAQAAMDKILAATASDKDTADQRGGDPQMDTAHDAARDLARLVDEA